MILLSLPELGILYPAGGMLIHRIGILKEVIEMLLLFIAWERLYIANITILVYVSITIII